MIAQKSLAEPSQVLNRNSKQFGELLAGFCYLQLLELGVDPSFHRLSPGVYLELGALGYLKWLWEQAERSDLFLNGLPKPSLAETNLIKRINSNPNSFASINGAQLSRRLFEYQMSEVSLNTIDDGAEEQVFQLAELQAIVDSDEFLTKLATIFIKNVENQN